MESESIAFDRTSSYKGEQPEIGVQEGTPAAIPISEAEKASRKATIQNRTGDIAVSRFTPVPVARDHIQLSMTERYRSFDDWTGLIASSPDFFNRLMEALRKSLFHQIKIERQQKKLKLYWEDLKENFHLYLAHLKRTE